MKSFTIESTSSFPINLPDDVLAAPLLPGEIVLTTLKNVKASSVVELLDLMCEGFILVPSELGTLSELKSVLPQAANGSENVPFPNPEQCDMVWSTTDNAARFYDGAEWITFTAATTVPAGNLNEKRASHSSALLKDGRILVIGGTAQPTRNSALASCELWNPDTQKFTTVAPMTQARFDHSSTVLPSGKVLVTGGLSSAVPFTLVTSSELYDPETDTWRMIAPNPVPRAYSAVGLLANGEVIIAGGNNTAGVPVLDTHAYDFVTDAWTAKAPMLSPQANEPESGLSMNDGTFVVVGGWNLHPLAPGWTAPANVSPNVQAYDPVSGQWAYAAPMSLSRAYHSAIHLPRTDRIAVFGGIIDGTDGHTGKLEIYSFSEDYWADLGELKTPRSGAAAALLTYGEAILAFGGFTGDVVTQSDDAQAVELGDQITGRFTANVRYQSNRGRKWGSAARYATGQVLVSGGVLNNVIQKTAYVYGSGQI